LRIFSGAGVFVRRCASRFPLAIASGALRSEIRFILEKFKLTEFFKVIVSANEVVHGKPHPETFLKALQGFNQRQPSGRPKILPEECLVIEDSVHGIESAHEAGMKCLAVAHSYPLGRVRNADWRAKHIRDLRLRDIESKFNRG
jgi:beta-phosphoglucomutase-like phosphatase (HAD superfamily)